MGKKVAATAPPEEKVELVVSTYWPTRIIKSITIKDLTSDYNNSITLDRGQAKYLFDQLNTLYGEAEKAK